MNRFMSRRVSRTGVAAGVVMLALALAGCSLNETLNEAGRIDYKSTSKLPPLDVPPDLVNPRGEDRYAIPERAQKARTYSVYQTARTTERPAGEVKVLPPTL